MVSWLDATTTRKSIDVSTSSKDDIESVFSDLCQQITDNSQDIGILEINATNTSSNIFSIQDSLTLKCPHVKIGSSGDKRISLQIGGIVLYDSLDIEDITICSIIEDDNSISISGSLRGGTANLKSTDLINIELASSASSIIEGDGTVVVSSSTVSFLSLIVGAGGSLNLQQYAHVTILGSLYLSGLVNISDYNTSSNSYNDVVGSFLKVGGDIISETDDGQIYINKATQSINGNQSSGLTGNSTSDSNSEEVMALVNVGGSFCYNSSITTHSLVMANVTNESSFAPIRINLGPSFCNPDTYTLGLYRPQVSSISSVQAIGGVFELGKSDLGSSVMFEVTAGEFEDVQALAGSVFYTSSPFRCSASTTFSDDLKGLGIIYINADVAFDTVTMTSAGSEPVSTLTTSAQAMRKFLVADETSPLDNIQHLLTLCATGSEPVSTLTTSAQAMRKFLVADETSPLDNIQHLLTLCASITSFGNPVVTSPVHICMREDVVDENGNTSTIEHCPSMHKEYQPPHASLFYPLFMSVPCPDCSSPPSPYNWYSASATQFLEEFYDALDDDLDVAPYIRSLNNGSNYDRIGLSPLASHRVKVSSDPIPITNVTSTSDYTPLWVEQAMEDANYSHNPFEIDVTSYSSCLSDPYSNPDLCTCIVDPYSNEALCNVEVDDIINDSDTYPDLDSDVSSVLFSSSWVSETLSKFVSFENPSFLDNSDEDSIISSSVIGYSTLDVTMFTLDSGAPSSYPFLDSTSSLASSSSSSSSTTSSAVIHTLRVVFRDYFGQLSAPVQKMDIGVGVSFEDIAFYRPGVEPSYVTVNASYVMQHTNIPDSLAEDSSTKDNSDELIYERVRDDDVEVYIPITLTTPIEDIYGFGFIFVKQASTLLPYKFPIHVNVCQLGATLVYPSNNKFRGVCSFCDSGYYKIETKRGSECIACPDHVQCFGGNIVGVDEGWWLQYTELDQTNTAIVALSDDSDSSSDALYTPYADTDGSLLLYPCPGGTSQCPGNASVLALSLSLSTSVKSAMCDGGSEGILCATCSDDNMYSDGLGCKTCPSQGTEMVISFAICGGVCLIVLIFLFVGLCRVASVTETRDTRWKRWKRGERVDEMWQCELEQQKRKQIEQEKFRKRLAMKALIQDRVKQRKALEANEKAQDIVVDGKGTDVSTAEKSNGGGLVSIKSAPNLHSSSENNGIHFRKASIPRSRSGSLLGSSGIAVPVQKPGTAQIRAENAIAKEAFGIDFEKSPEAEDGTPVHSGGDEVQVVHIISADESEDSCEDDKGTSKVQNEGMDKGDSGLGLGPNKEGGEDDDVVIGHPSAPVSNPPAPLLPIPIACHVVKEEDEGKLSPSSSGSQLTKPSPDPQGAGSGRSTRASSVSDEPREISISSSSSEGVIKSARRQLEDEGLFSSKQPDGTEETGQKRVVVGFRSGLTERERQKLPQLDDGEEKQLRSILSLPSFNAYTEKQKKVKQEMQDKQKKYSKTALTSFSPSFALMMFIHHFQLFSVIPSSSTSTSESSFPPMSLWVYIECIFFDKATSSINPNILMYAVYIILPTAIVCLSFLIAPLLRMCCGMKMLSSSLLFYYFCELLLFTSTQAAAGVFMITSASESVDSSQQWVWLIDPSVGTGDSNWIVLVVIAACALVFNFIVIPLLLVFIWRYAGGGRDVDEEQEELDDVSMYDGFGRKMNRQKTVLELRRERLKRIALREKRKEEKKKKRLASKKRAAIDDEPSQILDENELAEKEKERLKKEFPPPFFFSDDLRDGFHVIPIVLLIVRLMFAVLSKLIVSRPFFVYISAFILIILRFILFLVQPYNRARYNSIFSLSFDILCLSFIVIGFVESFLSNVISFDSTIAISSSSSADVDLSSSGGSIMNTTAFIFVVVINVIFLLFLFVKFLPKQREDMKEYHRQLHIQRVIERQLRERSGMGLQMPAAEYDESGRLRLVVRKIKKIKRIPSGPGTAKRQRRRRGAIPIENSAFESSRTGTAEGMERVVSAQSSGSQQPHPRASKWNVVRSLFSSKLGQTPVISSTKNKSAIVDVEDSEESVVSPIAFG
ncbi:hypothetical protein ADUPG1_000489 [Aduncisulcus paluster]|uniref:TRP C-terminal domain-containing protein n=1 Tax=Aduncisulcus paluster TaxID=2918883 RepID=A0ABQ5K6I5_9EUKA|nr:hypothetical protein ADUPG1_000489 [Aduncisulcus paluster]